MNTIILKGVRQNNLKNIDIEIPLKKAIVITGPSGSGKTSLAFETIYAEGQRRYMQSLSTYARQFLEKFNAPLVDSIKNIPPPIAVEQTNPVRNSRATVGTTTEVYDYLRLLYEKIGIPHCEDCDVPLEVFSRESFFKKVKKKYSEKTLFIVLRKTTEKNVKEFWEFLLQNGYNRAFIEGEVVSIEEYLKQGAKLKEAILVLDRIKISDSISKEVETRLIESLKLAFLQNNQVAELWVQKNDKYVFSETVTSQPQCPKCSKIYGGGTVSFSFNSPIGACLNCKGFGNTLEIDERLIIPNANLSLAQGAIEPFTKPSLNHWQKRLLQFCNEARIDADMPYKDLPPEHKEKVYEGEKKFKGVRGVFSFLQKDKYKMRIRVFLSRYQSPFLCPVCQGRRLKKEALRVKIQSMNIAEVCDLSFEESLKFIKKLKLTPSEKEVSKDVLKNLQRRLEYLNTIGLSYLTLSRLTKTLSGGEYQRILLATQLSQGLTETLYVLDEPSIGLHPKDTQKLIEILENIKALGNTLLIVEHDPELIEWAEHVIDMGPGSGFRGGEVLYNGDKTTFLGAKTKTSESLVHWKQQCRAELAKNKTFQKSNGKIVLKGAQGNNLKNVNLEIPLKSLVVVTGVSGSGKSTLIVDTLFQALSKMFHGQSEPISKFRSLEGFEYLNNIELIDQSAIGKSTRSNPITFIKGFDEIRYLFSQTPESIAKNYFPGHFSFNVAGGRCETCEGEGRVKIDMVFMEDVTIPCEVCNEKRFKPEILNVRYRGKNIDDVLKMTVDEAYDFFKSISTLKSKLALLQEVGLGYLTLGQPGFSLSGGEAQRLKIAKELSQGVFARRSTLFILDEPTTGLHFDEITKLIGVLRQLIHNGHSVVVIEHNVQLICHADYLIDLGPEGGSAGGKIVDKGTPQEVLLKKKSHTGKYLSEILGENKL